MKVLFVTTSYPADRSDSRGIHVHRLAVSLADRGVRVEVVVPAGPSTQEEDVIEGVRIHRVRYWVRRYQRLAVGLGGIVPNLRQNPLLVLQLPLLVSALAVATYRRSRDVDVVHAHWLVPSGALAALMARRPLVVTAHGGDVQLISRSCALRWIARRTLRRAGAVLGVSEAIAGQLRELGAARTARFQPLGVDESLLTSRRAIAYEPGAGAGPQLRVLQVGSLIDRKQPHIVLKALGLLKTTGVQIELVFIGDGPLRPLLEEDAARLGLTVHFAGNVPPAEIPAMLVGADLLVLPSLSEGRPLVIMEAMACGLPVVASDIAGVRELVSDGVTGLLVEPQNVSAFAESIRRMAEDAPTRVRFGSAARTRLVEMGLLASQIADDHIRLYEDACEGATP